MTASAQAGPTYPVYLNAEEIQRFIPHRDAMLFAQSVTVLAYNHYQGQVTWGQDSFVFKGHFPGRPIVPGVMIVEAAAQIAGVGARVGDPLVLAAAHTHIGVLASVRKCLFRRPVLPGMTLTFDLHARRISPGVAQIYGEASCEQGSVASLDFVFVQAPVEHIMSAAQVQNT
jgi:3-hydroxyacyl-[acyl-carrier-protein] dehydratase